MRHANMVRNVVAGMQEVLQQGHVPTENLTITPEPADHVANTVQITQQQLATQLQQIQKMMLAMHMQYAAAPQHAHQYYGGRGYHVGHTNYRV